MLGNVMEQHITTPFTQVLHMAVCTNWCSCLEVHYAKVDTAVLTEEYLKFPFTFAILCSCF